MVSTIEQANEMMEANNGNLDLSGCTGLTGKHNVRHLRNGDYVDGRYLYADGILTHVKKTKKINEYTYYIGKILGKNVVFDGKNYAYCDKIRDGIADLLFKFAADRWAEQYRGLTLDTEMTVEEAKTMYRIITGACKQGTQAFVDSFGDKLKERYTIHEILELTRGKYGAERFAQFFE